MYLKRGGLDFSNTPFVCGGGSVENHSPPLSPIQLSMPPRLFLVSWKIITALVMCPRNLDVYCCCYWFLNWWNCHPCYILMDLEWDCLGCRNAFWEFGFICLRFQYLIKFIHIDLLNGALFIIIYHCSLLCLLYGLMLISIWSFFGQFLLWRMCFADQISFLIIICRFTFFVSFYPFRSDCHIIVFLFRNKLLRRMCFSCLPRRWETIRIWCLGGLFYRRHVWSTSEGRILLAFWEITQMSKIF